MKYITFDHLDNESRIAVFNGLGEYNDQYASRNHADYTITLKNDDEIIGVAMGESKYDWLILQYLWIKSDFRKNGFGSMLLKKVEELAINRKLIGIHLDTFEFQAKEFYEKNGFAVFGEIKDHPKGYKRYFMKKNL